MAAISRAIWQAQPESLDESQFKLLPVLRAMWTIVAHTVHIPTPPYNGSVWAYDAVDIVSGQWLSAVFDRFNAANFVTFLDQIVAACPTGHITLIIDHAPAHIAQKVARWLDTQSRVTILFLPKYASHLNPIERIWGVAKNKVVANHCYQTAAALRKAVQTFLDSITPTIALQSTGLNV
jgi:transposase